MAFPTNEANLSNNTIHLTTVSRTPDPDRTLRIIHASEYPKQVWYLLASFIALVSLCHLISFVRTHPRKRPPPTNGFLRGAISYRKVFAAILDTYRAIAFRWTLPIGRSYTLNLAEVFLTAAYIAVLFTWALINCS